MIHGCWLTSKESALLFENVSAKQALETDHESDHAFLGLLDLRSHFEIEVWWTPLVYAPLRPTRRDRYISQLSRRKRARLNTGMATMRWDNTLSVTAFGLLRRIACGLCPPILSDLKHLGRSPKYGPISTHPNQ